MQRCRIESLGVSLPRRTWPRWGSVKHATEAGRRCLASSPYRPADVALLINTGVHRDQHICEPANAAYIQHQLGINIEFQGRRTLSFDLLNGACGMLTAVHVMASMMKGNRVQVGLVVSSEVNTDRTPDPSYPYQESGAALLMDLSPEAEVGLGAMAFHTHEEHADLWTSTVSLKVRRGKLLVRREAQVHGLLLAKVGDLLDDLLQREGLTRDALDLVIPAQLAAPFLAQLPAALGLPAEKVVNYTDQLPDTHSTSLFLALHRLRSTCPVAPGQRALLLAFGAGLTLGGAIYQF